MWRLNSLKAQKVTMSKVRCFAVTRYRKPMYVAADTMLLYAQAISVPKVVTLYDSLASK